jgi:hypothetical protein
MDNPGSARRDDDREITRVTQDIAGRLRQRGVAVHDDESPEEIVLLLEQVEAFERAVESAGGDLMVDEPPADGSRQPDNPAFLIPSRSADETATAYLNRLIAATDAIREDFPTQ